ncbi:prepilin-type cleavage/methylation domain-contai ning protein [Desulfonema ishimotonii]|uniref:Prepilin-type cleavage/methylation domain-contai ning protein n=1 Tax=Desulfonema ishimotonii TaxID=45657 RepID=A0A401G4C5_9BACT|nr:prepilin-type N-terminal cleavage/methylation domain-containing protein [Desulfonema ishimotonii]GBC64064.1 prepilin-type cleavage/methylation domain-contai ning protein [Desulfonema ishimotonii]
MTDNARPEKSPCGGFTLLEVIVAVSIIGIVLVAVFRMQSQTILMNQKARFYTLAPLLAQQALAKVSIRAEKGEISGSGDFGEELPGYAWQASGEDVESEALGEAAENLKQIDVTVSFNGDEMTYGFRTYRLMPEKG